MENTQNPSYDELMQAYQKLAQQMQNANVQIANLQADRIDTHLQVLMHIIENKDAYNQDIIELAEWHMKRMLAKHEE